MFEEFGQLAQHEGHQQDAEPEDQHDLRHHGDGLLADLGDGLEDGDDGADRHHDDQNRPAHDHQRDDRGAAKLDDFGLVHNCKPGKTASGTGRRPSHRHAQDFLISVQHLVAHGCDGLQRHLGVGHRLDDVAQVGLADGGQRGHVLALLQGADALLGRLLQHVAEGGAVTRSHAGAGRLGGGGGISRGGVQRIDHGGGSGRSGRLAGVFGGEPSGAQEVERAGQHLARGVDGRQVGFVAALGLAHVHRLHHRIDVGHQDIAVGVGRRVRRIVLALEIALVHIDLGDADLVDVHRPVQLVLEDDGLAAIGQIARRFGGGVGVGQILRNDLQARALRLHARGGHRHRLVRDGLIIHRTLAHPHHLVFQHDVVAVRRRLVRIAHLLFLGHAAGAAGAGQMGRVGRHRSQPPAVAQRVAEAEGLQVAALVFGRVGVGDVLRQDFLALGQPVHLARHQFEESEISEVHRPDPAAIPPPIPPCAAQGAAPGKDIAIDRNGRPFALTKDESLPAPIARAASPLQFVKPTVSRPGACRQDDVSRPAPGPTPGRGGAEVRAGHGKPAADRRHRQGYGGGADPGGRLRQWREGARGRRSGRNPVRHRGRQRHSGRSHRRGGRNPGLCLPCQRHPAAGAAIRRESGGGQAVTRPPSTPPSSDPPLPEGAESAAGIAQRAAALGATLDDARAQAEAGVLIDLAGLEDRVAHLCLAAEALPRGDARTLLGPLGDLVAALGPLAAALTDQQKGREEAVAAALAGRDDPHTARQRAAAAYGRIPGPAGSGMAGSGMAGSGMPGSVYPIPDGARLRGGADHGRRLGDAPGRHGRRDRARTRPPAPSERGGGPADRRQAAVDPGPPRRPRASDPAERQRRPAGRQHAGGRIRQRARRGGGRTRRPGRRRAGAGARRRRRAGPERRAGAGAEPDLRPGRRRRHRHRPHRPDHRADHGSVAGAVDPDHDDGLHPHRHRAVLPAQRAGRAAGAADHGDDVAGAVPDLLRDGPGVRAQLCPGHPAADESGNRRDGGVPPHHGAAPRFHAAPHGREGSAPVHGHGPHPVGAGGDRHAAACPGPGLHDLGDQARVRDRLPVVPALPHHRHGGVVDPDVDGHDDAAADHGGDSVQDHLLRAGRRVVPDRRVAGPQFRNALSAHANRENSRALRRIPPAPAGPRKHALASGAVNAYEERRCAFTVGWAGRGPSPPRWAPSIGPRHRQARDADPRRPGRRLRRHRHQPALHAARMLRRRAWAAADPRQRAGHHVAGVLGAGDGRHREICGLRHAGRQQGRGRHPLPAGAGVEDAAGRLGPADRADGAGPVRRRAVLRRRHDHPGDVGAVRGRGAGRGRAGAGIGGGAADRRHRDRPVRHPEPRHLARRRAVRPDHAGLVRHAWRAGAAGSDPAAERAGRLQPALRHRLLRQSRHRRFPGAGRGGAGGDRRRGALCRHGPFRPPPDPGGLAGRGAAGAAAELSGPVRAAAERSDGGAQPLLPAGAGMGALSADRAVHRRRRHRQPGGDLRRLLADPAGGPARALPASRHPPHLQRGGRADLHPPRQLGPAGRGAGAGAGLPIVEPSRRRLRHRGDRRHDHHHLPVPGGGAPPLELEPAGLPRRRRRLPDGGDLLLRRQRGEDPAWRLGAAGDRLRHARPDVHLAPWPRGADQAAGRGIAAARRLHPAAGEEGRHPPGPARAHRLRHRRGGRRAARPSQGPRAGRGAGRRLLPHHRALRLLAGAEHPEGPAPVQSLRAGVRRDGDLLLPGPRDADPADELPDGAVAGKAVRGDVPHLGQRHRLLQAAAQPRGGTRHPGTAVAS
ncbi:hypothetical protein Lal_00005115 [Lupinus albus]|nr:hypothetical protein Lal_00005115 [Lupinus albus]